MRLVQPFPGGKIDAVFDDEPDPRKWLLYEFISDMYGQEDVYLAELAKAEAGEATDIYNEHVKAYMYPDYVVLEDRNDSDLQNGEEGPPSCTRLSLAETKQLILDWLEARERFFVAQELATAPYQDKAAQRNPALAASSPPPDE